MNPNITCCTAMQREGSCSVPLSSLRLVETQWCNIFSDDLIIKTLLS